MRNICKYIDTPDADLLDKIITCIESGATLPKDPDIIEESLAKEWQNSFVTCFRKEAEDKMGIDEDDETFDQDTLALFEGPRGVEIIVKIFLYVLLNGKADGRTDAAFSIGIVSKFADLKYFKKYVIKMAGALIRIANDKFDDELKIAIFRALRRMFDKAAKVMKPMSAPLKTTFSQYAKQSESISPEVKEELKKLEEVVNATLLKKK